MTMAPNESRRRSRAALVACGVAALATVLAANPVYGQDKRLVGRLEPETALSVTRLADSVRAAGLPSDPLVAVALEGASRRAASDRILGAVREYAAALGIARQTLGDSAVSDEIVSAAGGAWHVALPLASGRHVYAFVVDGSSWVADPQAPLAPERWFGTPNSVLLVNGERRQ